MVPVEKRILVKVANMYYIDNMKQSEIAKKMGVDRTTISKKGFGTGDCEDYGRQ